MAFAIQLEKISFSIAFDSITIYPVDMPSQALTSIEQFIFALIDTDQGKTCLMT